MRSRISFSARFWLPFLAMFLIASRSSGAAAYELNFKCDVVRSAKDQQVEMAAVNTALRATAPARAALERALDGEDTTQASKERSEAAQQAYDRKRSSILVALAEAGNGEAVYQLAYGLRASRSTDDVRRWLELTTCASEIGNPYASDELVRWYWHQKGDGGIDAIQKNRRKALDYAEKAAQQGLPGAILRIAVYISGDVHQYPASLTLGRKIIELCAQTDDRRCQENLASRSPYDYGQDVSDEAFWFQRLALGDGPMFAPKRDRAMAKLMEEQRRAVTARLASWKPSSWLEMGSSWPPLRDQIIEHGAASPGAPSACSTATPWCFVVSPQGR